MHVARADVVPLADVPALEHRTRRQHDVGERRFAFPPHRLIDDEFQALVLIGLDPAIGSHLRAKRRAAVLVEHLHAHVAGRGVAKGKELPLDRGHIGEITHGLALGDRFGEPHARDRLSHRAHGHDVRHTLVIVGGVCARGEFTREAAFAVSREIEIEIERCAELQIAEVGARSTVALHGTEDGHHARPLRAHRTAAGAAQTHAPTAGTEIGFL
jgi:hypothetical protein